MDVHSLPRRLAAWVSRRSRRAKLALFVELVGPTPATTVLDVGVEDGAQGDAEVFATGNFIEHGWPTGRLTAVGLHEGSGFMRAFPGIDYVQADARALPFSERTFDAVLCNAVIEHVGNKSQQRRLVTECCRVGRLVVITTPNRWFPIEVHTLWPLVHWLPERWYRPILRRTAPDRVGDIRLLTPRGLAGLFPATHRVTVVKRGISVVVIAELNECLRGNKSSGS